MVSPRCGAWLGFEVWFVVGCLRGGNIPLGGGWFAVDGRSREDGPEKMFFELEDSSVGDGILPKEKGEFLGFSFEVALLDASVTLSGALFTLSEAEDAENFDVRLARDRDI